MTVTMSEACRGVLCFFWFWVLFFFNLRFYLWRAFIFLNHKQCQKYLTGFVLVLNAGVKRCLPLVSVPQIMCLFASASSPACPLMVWYAVGSLSRFIWISVALICAYLIQRGDHIDFPGPLFKTRY